MEHPLFIFLATLFTIASRGISQVSDCKPGNSGSKVAVTVVVDHSGMGNFKRIQEAIDSIPANNDRWIKVQINPGTYTEQVAIPIDKPCIFLEGQDSSLTTITYNAHERTDLSATFASRPTNIVAKGITFQDVNFRASLRNYTSTNWITDEIIACLPTSKQNSFNRGVVPAVSAAIYGDKTAFYNCAFLGFQDTIWDALGRHYFSNCYIEGAVDFIFGDGKSFYEGCSINVIGDGFITAQGREFPFETNGFVFSNCTVTGLEGFQAYLGRAYRPYATVIFQSSFLSEVVQPLGWDAWQYPGQESNFTFAEVDCKGPGSDTSKRVPWEKKLDGNQLEKFSKSSFIDRDGWLAELPL